MKTESSTNSPTATLAPTKSQRDPVGLQATSPPSHLTGDLRTDTASLIGLFVRLYFWAFFLRPPDEQSLVTLG